MPVLQVEIPKFTKCFLCLPLRGCIIAWGLLEVSLSFLAIIILLMMSSVYLPKGVALLVISLLFWILNGVISITLICAIFENNIRYLNNCYTYYVLKWYFYAFLLFIGLVLLGFDHQTVEDVHRYIDLVTRYTIFNQISLGFLCFLLMGYFTLLVRSLILELGGTPCVSLRPLKFKITCVTAADPELQRIDVEENPVATNTDGPDVGPPKYEEVNRVDEHLVLSVALPVANVCQEESSGCSPVTESGVCNKVKSTVGN